MKIIFLDIDGVMNSQDRALFIHEQHKKGLISDEELYNWDLPYKDTLEALNYIVKNTGAKIVLSSTWRGNPDRIKKLNNCFKPYGFEIYDKTCHGVYHKDLKKLGFNLRRCYSSYTGRNTGLRYTTDRGAEIAKWLSDHPDVESFVILDDDIADIKPYYTKEHIQTDFYKDALNMDCAKRAVQILNKEETDHAKG